MAQLISPENHAAWLAAAERAGLTVEDTREELINKAAVLGFDAHWMSAHGHDILGVEQERMMAIVRGTETYYEGELLAANSVEEAIRLVVGEALIAQS